MRVGIGANGPRYSAGAFGFGSKVSRWLGAPQRKTKTTDLARPPVAARPIAAAPGKPSASGTEAPQRKNDRRVTPEQVRAGKRPTSNMRPAPVGGIQGCYGCPCRADGMEFANRTVWPE